MGLMNASKTAVLLLFLALASCDAFAVVDISLSTRSALRLLNGARSIRSHRSNEEWWVGPTSSSSFFNDQTGLIPGVDPCHHGAPSCWVPEPQFEDWPPAEPEARSGGEPQQLELLVKELKTELQRSQNEQEKKTQQTLEKLIDVSDNLARALEAVPETEKERNDSLKTLCEGIEMTEKALHKVMERNGLVQYGTIGEPFDHHLHHALYEFPDPEREAGTVGQIIKAGYLLNGERVLRYAEVAVVK